jgi:hypothetical protein
MPNMNFSHIGLTANRLKAEVLRVNCCLYGKIRIVIASEKKEVRKKGGCAQRPLLGRKPLDNQIIYMAINNSQLEPEHGPGMHSTNASVVHVPKICD